MAKLVYGLNMSLDGYIDHTKFGPSITLFNHFIEQVGGLTGILYGRGMYEVMRYWDDDQPDWEAHEHKFATVWRSRRKWVASHTLKSVGPNATLIADDAVDAVRRLKAEHDGEIDIAGSVLAQSMTEAGLIDEYRMYVHPVVVGSGKPFFAGPRARLRLIENEIIAEDVIRLTYVPS